MLIVPARSLFVHFYSTVLIGDEVSISFNPPLPPAPRSRLHLVNGVCPLGRVEVTLQHLESERGVTLVPGSTKGPFHDLRVNQWWTRPPMALFARDLNGAALVLRGQIQYVA